MVQDWRPNWRNEDEYPDPDTTTAQQWAWEFLRRNQDYQDDYDEIGSYEASVDGLEQLKNAFLACFPNVKAFGHEPTFRSLMNHVLLSLIKCKQNYPWVPEMYWRLVEEYNLRWPIDPKRKYVENSFIEQDNLPVVETEAFKMIRIGFDDQEIPPHRRLTITFDCNNLKDQLEYVKGIFSAYKKNEKIKRRSEYRKFLRLLDGLHGEKRGRRLSLAKELGLYNHRNERSFDSYDKALRKAKKLRDVGFFELSKSGKIASKGGRFQQGKKDGKHFFDMITLDPRSLRQTFPAETIISTGNISIQTKFPEKE